MIDKRTIFNVVLASYAVAVLAKLVPALAPSAVASYVPSIGGSSNA